MKVDQSMITGESEPVESVVNAADPNALEARNIIFNGSLGNLSSLILSYFVLFRLSYFLFFLSNKVYAISDILNNDQICFQLMKSRCHHHLFNKRKKMAYKHVTIDTHIY